MLIACLIIGVDCLCPAQQVKTQQHAVDLGRCVKDYSSKPETR